MIINRIIIWNTFQIIYKKWVSLMLIWLKVLLLCKNSQHPSLSRCAMAISSICMQRASMDIFNLLGKEETQFYYNNLGSLITQSMCRRINSGRRPSAGMRETSSFKSSQRWTSMLAKTTDRQSNFIKLMSRQSLLEAVQLMVVAIMKAKRNY